VLLMPSRKYICPKCKQKRGVTIMYGMPPAPPEEDEVFGGCVIEEGQPDRHCLNCEHEWQIVRRADPWDIPDRP
jgi:hypothetical protein